jgi:hypothetical protein
MTPMQVFVAVLATVTLAPGEMPGAEGGRPRHMTSPVILSTSGGGLSSLSNGSAWINSPPLTATDLRGKVVLIAGAGDIGHDLVSVAARGAEVGADWATLKSPETYVRVEGIERFASPGGPVLDQRHAYAAPARLALNEWAFAGAWTMRSGVALLNEASGRIVYRFHARDVNLVMGPTARGASVRFRVLVDGRPPGAAHGADVDEQGRGTVKDQRMYQLIRLAAPIVDRQFEIEFLDPGIEAFVFTFG